MTARSRLSLDGQWNFWTDPDISLSALSLNSDNARRILVPVPWQSQSPQLRDYIGVAWYQRTLDIPADWLNHIVILGFGAVDYLAEVWINAVKVGEHEGGYLPCEFDVTPALRAGLNTLTVRVDDSSQVFAEIPHGKQSWYGPLSGLWQSVWIERRPTTHIQHIKITPHANAVDVAVSLNRPLAADQTLSVEILAPDGTLAARAESRSPHLSIPISNPQLWEIDSPNLYALRSTLYEHTTAADILTESFGFRTIETRAGQLLLNGRPLYLRGALDQDYYPDLICTPPSVEFIEDQFRRAKAMGLNCLRIHIKIADARYYAAADRLGLLIWTELPNWILLTDDSKRRAKETLAGMVERDWNHPSIVIWTIINESWGLDLTNPKHRAWLAETYAYVKALDPYRLIVDNSACWGNFHIVTDIEDYHYYCAIPDHYLQWRDWVANFAIRPPWTYAHAYENGEASRDFMRSPWTPTRTPRLPAPEVRRRGDEPLVVSEFGNWGLPEVDKLIEGYGGQEPWWFETGHEWGDGVVYPHGIEERFRAYHLQRAFPTLSALSAASQHAQIVALKYEIEQMRRHTSIQGYVITEFTDVHWECNGLLDMHRHPKAITAALAQFNADDVIVSEWSRVAFWEGEQCEVILSLSHYSKADLHGSQLDWQLVSQGDIHGSFEKLKPGRATLTNVGTVTFIVPAVQRGTRAHLELRLIKADGSLVASNYLELYFFPRAAQTPQSPNPSRVFCAPPFAAALHALGYARADSLAGADVALVNALTDDLRDYVLNGGRVLWLAESLDVPQAGWTINGLDVLPRQGKSWQGDWASSFSWLYQDKMFADLPTDSLVGFAFADLTPDYILHGFAPREFSADVHAGLFVGWLHKTVALIGERRVGHGRVLASTFRLSQHLTTNPVAALMLRDMLAHLAQA